MSLRSALARDRPSAGRESAGGYVCFDGAGFGPEPRVGIGPEQIVEGGWDDWGLLEDALMRLQRAGASGGLAGWFDYSGGFRFGVFPAWTEDGPGGLDGALPAPAPDFLPGLERPQWMALVRRAREYIAAGDIYQVNLTHTLTAPWTADPLGFYPRLCAASPAPYSCFLRLGDTEVLSSSPECFLRIGGRRVVTRPIKGTRPRVGDDAAAAHELMTSAKERAELVMITDLERNDLGQVCDYGTVCVTGLCELETFAQVHHLVSTVEGRLRPGVSAIQAVRACYPGGSITGAPKKRAREIIAELEPVPRGIYTGALGFFGCDGGAVFNIAIRTLVVRGGGATYGVGAGIVADSDPALEYEETLHKAAGLAAALHGMR
ncbi:MAG: anthranilate synthase component I family protein [Chthoniobacterales bacterium]|nr:anthranilate synthase component I family protein [Chthoniobacterales bacterium]